MALAVETLDRSDEGADLWCAVLEAVRRSALRQGYLRLALRAHSLAARAAEAAGDRAPERIRSDEDMRAVEALVDGHREHGLPTSLTRYLARSLGHRDGDSPNGAAEVARDLSLTPDDLGLALHLATEHGFEDRVGPRLAGFQERLFRGNWRTRRRLQRGLLALFWVLIALGLVFGLTLLQHAL